MPNGLAREKFGLKGIAEVYLRTEVGANSTIGDFVIADTRYDYGRSTVRKVTTMEEVRCEKTKATDAGNALYH